MQPESPLQDLAASSSSRRSSPRWVATSPEDQQYPPVGDAFGQQFRPPPASSSSRPSSPRPSSPPRSSSPRPSSPPLVQSSSQLPSSPPRPGPKPFGEGTTEKILLLTCLVSLATNLLTLLVVAGGVLLVILSILND